MGRLHIHFTFRLEDGDKVLSGVRRECDAFVYVNLIKALESGLKFYLSENEVILCSGCDRGFIHQSLIMHIKDRNGNVL